MSNIEIEIYPDDQWVDRVTSRWAAFMEKEPAARLCLPTGSTPQAIYERAASTIDFARTEVFVLDEFGLPPGDPARCDEMLDRDLLSRMSRRPLNVHTLNPQAPDMTEECRRFATLVEAGGLDLTVLGLGRNGHVGLNEPGSAANSPTRVVQLRGSTIEDAGRYGSDVSPTWGVTLGLRQILASREIWLLVIGRHKAGILQRTLTEPIGRQLPATFLRRHPRTTVLADESAASLL